MHAVSSSKKSDPTYNGHEYPLSAVPGKSTVLIVDCDQAGLGALSRQLIHQGYAVATADSTKQARELLATRPFDLILVDTGKNETEANKLCRWLKDRDGYNVIPVVIIGDSI